MKDRLNKVAAAFLFSALAAAPLPALATDVTLYFSGTILPGSYAFKGGVARSWDNQPFFGAVTFDLANGNESGSGSGSWALTNRSTITLCLPDALVVGKGWHASDFSGSAHIQRNYVNPLNSNAVLLYATGYDYDRGSVETAYLHFDWQVADYLGTRSTLFADPNGGLSWDQPFNLTGYAYTNPIGSPAGRGQNGSFDLVGLSREKLNYHYYAEFILSSIGTTQAVSQGPHNRCDQPMYAAAQYYR